MKTFKSLAWTLIALSLTILTSCQKDDVPCPSGNTTKAYALQNESSDTQTAAANNAAAEMYEFTDIQSLTASYKLEGTTGATYIYPKDTYLAHGIIEVQATLKNGETVNLKEYENYSPDHLSITDNSEDNLIYEDWGTGAFVVYADADTWGGTATVTISYEGVTTTIANVRYAPGLQSVTFSVNDCNKSVTASFLRAGYNFLPKETEWYGVTPYVELDVEKQYRGAEFTITAVNTAGNKKVIESAWCFENGGSLPLRNRNAWAYLWQNYFDYDAVYCIQGEAEDYF